jgi:predicted outer membrane repeat protein
MRNPNPRHRGARSTAAILAGVACLFAAAAPATANSYHDYLCRIPYGPEARRAAPADDVTYSTNGTFVFAGDSCASGGALYASMDGEVPHPDGAGGSGTFTAPAGLTITGFTVWRYEADGPVQPFGAPASNLLYSPGPASVQGLCAQSLGCSSRGTPSNPLASENAVSVSGLSGVTQIQWSASCGGGPGGECPASGAGTLSSQYDVYAADIDLVDNTPPVVHEVGGPLVAGGTLSGQQTISFNASDGQSGIYAGTLLVDGHAAVSQILNNNGGACRSLGTTGGQRSFEHAQPCAPSVSTSLTLNTTVFAAGQHSLELIVEDAAANQTVAFDGSIVTSGPPVVGVNGGGIAGRGAPNGEPCAGEALEVAVNNERTPPVVQYGKPVTIRGVLHCGTVPIRNARVAINTIGAPAGAAVATSVQTALDGSLTYKLPRGPSRTLHFSYTAYSNDPGPSATATVTIAIRPKIHLRIKPNTTRNGHKIYWSGMISGGPYPRQGVTLDIEVKEGPYWRFFNQTRAGRKGHFHFKYRFHATTEPTTYTFRVALPNTGAHGYPYVHSASNTINIHVNP